MQYLLYRNVRKNAEKPFFPFKGFGWLVRFSLSSVSLKHPKFFFTLDAYDILIVNCSIILYVPPSSHQLSGLITPLIGQILTPSLFSWVATYEH